MSAVQEISLWMVFGLACSCPAWPKAHFQERLDGKPERRVTVADAIGMSQWANQEYFLGAKPDAPVALFSPDKTRFVVMVKRGNLDRDTVDYSLLLFATKDALKSPRPRLLVTMVSSSNRDAIASPRWLADNRTIVFLGERQGKSPQVYRLDASTGRLRPLTHHPTPIVRYAVNEDGKSVVYEAVAERWTRPGQVRRQGLVVGTETPAELFRLGEDHAQKVEATGRELFVLSGGLPPRKVQTHSLLSEDDQMFLSPTGRFALLTRRVTEIPEAWAAYEDAVLRSTIANQRSLGSWSNVLQYMLLDLSTLELKPLLEAPVALLNHQVVWTDKDSSVIVSGAFLPLSGVDAAVGQSRRASPYIAEISLPSLKVEAFGQADAAILDWDARRAELRVSTGPKASSNPGEIYRKTSRGWEAIARSLGISSVGDALQVVLEEDMNSPPKIYAIDVRNQERHLLLDLNPQFARLQMGKVEAIVWTASDGHEVMGGLYLPPGYRPGRRYPLVIQTHGFRQDRFWIDGPWSGAFAAQPLAARDIVVLQVGGSVHPEGDEGAADTVGEAPRQLAAYEGAIDFLDRRGIVDRDRVGIIGFSRTVFYVEYALTHSRYRFRAASLADGFDGGYMNYLLWPNDDYIAVNGGQPAGAGLAAWMKASPGFNLDRVSTPVRLECYGRGSFLGGWEWFSGLNRLNKPVDLIWLPDGYHLLLKPWEKLVSQQGTVDWFTFWLEGSSNSDPAKREQYRRWEGFRSRIQGGVSVSSAR